MLDGVSRVELTDVANGTVIADAVKLVPTGGGTTQEAIRYLHTDQLNAPRLATDPAQQVLWRWDGQAFGDSAPSGSITVNLRYPGQYFDGETGLHYNWHRYYDPKIGRYITSDPIGLAGGLNTYVYVLNNPLRWTDPYGLEVLVCGQPAFGWMPVDHQWIKTDTVERGMGGMRGNVPGNESGDRYGDPVQVTDHSGRSKEAGSSCKKVENVDESKVNEQLKLGHPLGRFTPPTNHCQSFVQEVLRNASTLPPPPQPRFDFVP